MAKLKPCPFCGDEIPFGGHVFGRDGSERFGVWCTECSIRIERNSMSEAIEAWNRRATDEELEFTRNYIHDQGLEWDLLSKWEARKND